MRISLGSERLLDSSALSGKRVGVVCNPASVDHGFVHIIDRVAAAAQRDARARSSGPQHGFRSDVQDNMIETAHAKDATRRVPVYSLYSETREPTAEMLAGLDVLVIDLQDVGTRIYTYIYTMANCLTAAQRARRQGRSSAIGPTRSAATERRRADARARASSRSSGSIRSRCGTA